ncbi:hypothetical protein TNIN_271421 [Trichonephila inaurata madagascariensis]|uniref:Uncharacterized protein n=1 Tax=Trichonephila inaurata madagascariensis TaxID=2747483 RepID=A0A8X6YDC4_9ARAC|nr:hypothetical protein TNIN_271421 [Trichonephila inaurata madagascariensis]
MRIVLPVPASIEMQKTAPEIFSLFSRWFSFPFPVKLIINSAHSLWFFIPWAWCFPLEISRGFPMDSAYSGITKSPKRTKSTLCALAGKNTPEWLSFRIITQCTGGIVALVAWQEIGFFMGANRTLVELYTK